MYLLTELEDRNSVNKQYIIWLLTNLEKFEKCFFLLKIGRD